MKRNNIFVFGIAMLLLFAVQDAKAQKSGSGPTDTLLYHEFYALPGNPSILTYGYSNGNGFFFGTNFMDLDQDPNTPYQPGAQAFAQGFPVDSTQNISIISVLLRVGYKQKSASSTGTPLLLSINYLDDSSSYNINTSGGTQSYTIHRPGTSLASASIPFDSIKTGAGYNYTVAHLYSPVPVNKNFAVVIDLVDWYLNGDRLGFFVSPPNGGSNIYGQEYTLWLYPDPFIWLQVNHLYTNINRAIAIFPVIDDGTYGIDDDHFINGLKLGQNHPNPAKQTFNVVYETQEAAPCRLEINDINGKSVLIKELGKQTPGKKSISIDISALAPGVYFYTLFNGDKHLSKRMIKQ